MKKLLLFIASGFITASSFAQTISIAEARTKSIGTTVTVKGVVTNGAELGAALRNIQDGTAGITAYSSSKLTTVLRGDSIIISGVLKSYNNLLEIDPVNTVTVISQGNPLPAPIEFNSGYTAAYAEQYESMLIRFNGLNSVTSSTGGTVTSFAGNTNYKLDGLYDMRVNSASTGTAGIIGKTPPSGGYSIIGIMGQYNATNPAAGYQLLPRLYEDFILGEKPNISTSITAINITTTGFTLQFSTLNNGSTQIDYGTTTSLGSTVTDTTGVTFHSIAITGLLPSTIYYVRATSTNASGSSVSSIIPMITASNSTGEIKAYFTRSVDTSKAYLGNQAAWLENAVDDTLINFINKATTTLDIAIYNWNNNGISNITAAVNAAYTKGVIVRVVADGSTANLGLDGLNSGIKKILSPDDGGATYGIMHNKFVIIDANHSDPNKSWVWTGATNWTQGQINDDANNVVVFQDQSMAKAYTLEFEEMWGSKTAVPNTAASKFGPYKADNTPHYFNLKGTNVEVFFSPTDGVTSKMVNTIGTANYTFQFSTMLNTRSDIATAIKNQYLTVSDKTCSMGIIGDTSSTGSTGPYFTIANEMGSNFVIDTLPFTFHHKYLLVDANSSSDPIVWTGSHNWSNGAETKNDENTVVIHHGQIANQFYQEFSGRYKDMNRVPCDVNCIIPLNLNITSTPPSACGVLDATATSAPSNGTSPYTYSWSNGDLTSTADQLPTGNLLLTVTDSKGCVNTDSVLITNNGAPVLSFSSSDVLCFGGATGQATTTPTGGSSPYTYSWSNGNSTSTISNLLVGVYSVEVTDSAACKTYGSVEVFEPSLLAIDHVVGNVTCAGTSTGSINVTPVGGVAPYTYSWGGGETTEDLNGIPSGGYSLVLTDLNGCSENASWTLTEPILFAASINENDITCFGLTNGTASVSISGGKSPYTYSWSTGATAGAISGLPAGPIQLFAKDANNCSANAVDTIFEPESITITVDNIVSSQSGANQGSIQISVSGGTTPYTYSWDNGATTEDITGLNPGNYVVTVKDQKGCTKASNPIIVDLLTSINQLKSENTIIVQPNPASIFINVGFSSEVPVVSTIKLMSVNGQLIYTETSSKPLKQFATKIDVEVLPKGLYFIQVISGDKLSTRKLIKE